MATLSILGLYTFDNTLFDLMCWPSQFTDDDKQATINNILMEGAELEILYPDAVFMKSAIAAWSYKEKPVWQRIHTASLLEYNPIENYRRNETESIESSKTEQHSGNDTTSHSGKDTTNNTGKDTTNNTGTDTTAHTGTESSTSSNTNTTTGSDSGTIDHKVSGYDSNTLVQQSQDSTTGSSSSKDTQTGTSAVTHNTQDEVTHNTQIEVAHNTQVEVSHNTQDQLTHGEKIEHSGDDARTLLAYGNIGVTTSQEMLEQELNIAPKLNTISVIVDSFIKRFCILVY